MVEFFTVLSVIMEFFGQKQKGIKLKCLNDEFV